MTWGSQQHIERMRAARRGQWRTTTPSYRQMHYRLKTYRGRSDRKACVDCGKRAGTWSLSWRGVPRKELLFSAQGTPYTTNMGAYDPRCRSCNLQYDKGSPRPKAEAA